MLASNGSRPLKSNGVHISSPFTSSFPSSNNSLTPTSTIGNGSGAWNDGASIWGRPALSRESSQTRESPSYLATQDGADLKPTTSPSGFMPAKSDVWNKVPRQVSGWATNGASSHDRSSTISPVDRRDSTGNDLLKGSQPLPSCRSRTSETKSRSRVPEANGFFSSGDMSSVNHGLNGAGNPFGHHHRSSNDSSQAHGSVSSWAIDNSVHSPTDDRASASGQYFAPSGPPSSQHSLPPSRDGVRNTYSQPIDSPFRSFGNLAPSTGRGNHTPSLSSVSAGRFPDLRPQSGPGYDLSQVMGRLHLDPEADFSFPRLYSQYSNMNGLHAVQGEESDLLARQAAAGYFPESPYSSSIPSAPSATLSRGSAVRGAFSPGATDGRFFPSTTTPAMYDSAYASSTSTAHLRSLATPTNPNPQHLERRLRSLQQEQNQFFGAVPSLPSALPNPYRTSFALNGYNDPYAMVGGYPMHHSMNMSHLVHVAQSPYPMGEVPLGPRPAEGTKFESQLLVEFRAANKSGKAWQLRDIQGFVVEFCGDQVGSRFIQSKLESANSDEKLQIFREIMPDLIQLMQDVFGNYVIQKFFDHGDQKQKAEIAAKMSGHLFKLSTQMYACRVVQKAIEHILTDQQAALIRELEPNVIQCVKDMNGNHVIQKAIQEIPAQHIQFIVDQFTGKTCELSTHAYGCRVIQRVLEHCAEPIRRTILTELHSCRNTLIVDAYGNYVTQHMIQYGWQADRDCVIELVTKNVVMYGCHKFASNVVEKCFEYGTPQQKSEMLKQILASPPNERGESSLAQMIKDQYGNYVIQKMLDMLSGDDFHSFISHLKPEIQLGKQNPDMNQKHIAAVEKRLRNHSRHNSRDQNNAPHTPLTPLTPAVPQATVGASSSSAHTPQLPQIKVPPPENRTQLQPPVGSPNAFRSPTGPRDRVGNGNAKFRHGSNL